MVLPHHGMHNKKSRNGGLPTRDTAFGLSLGLNVLLALCLLYLSIFLANQQPGQVKSTREKEMVWHGGHPEEARAGSCWCGAADRYCMCTPNIAIDLIIVSGKNKEYLWLVRRSDTNQLAIMGGFVDVDETVEHAVKRELKEEMGVDLFRPPTLFGVYSDPRRDNRRRTASAVFAVPLDDDAHPRAGDDAKEVKRIPMDDIEKYSYFADHLTILLDYRRFVRGESPKQSTEGDFAPDIHRSTCAHAASPTITLSPIIASG